MLLKQMSSAKSVLTHI